MSITTLTAPSAIPHSPSSEASAIGSPDPDADGDQDMDVDVHITDHNIDQDFAHPSSASDASDYDEQPPQPQPRRGRGAISGNGNGNGNGYTHHNQQGLNLANADPQLYGLRRSVSGRSESPPPANYLYRFSPSNLNSEQKPGHSLCMYSFLPSTQLS